MQLVIKSQKHMKNHSGKYYTNAALQHTSVIFIVVVRDLLPSLSFMILLDPLVTGEPVISGLGKLCELFTVPYLLSVSSCHHP